MRKYLIGLALVLPLAGSAVPATEMLDTQIMCTETKLLFSQLRNEYQESPIIVGETNDEAGSAMSVWISKSGETWTIVASKNDIACVVGAGTNLRIIRKGKTI